MLLLFSVKALKGNCLNRENTVGPDLHNQNMTYIFTALSLVLRPDLSGSTTEIISLRHLS
jgi:hypothetical protein